MRADQIVSELTNAGITLRAMGQQIKLSPAHEVNARHRQLVTDHKAALLEYLARWPDATAPGRSFWRDPPRADEMGRPARHRPQVITGRRRR